VSGQDTVATPPDASHLPHDALFFDTPADAVKLALPFVYDGLDTGDAVLLASGSVLDQALREEIGAHPRLHVMDHTRVYPGRPAAAITTFRRLAVELTGRGARTLRVVGQPSTGSTPRHQLEWQRYEAVINHVLASWPLWGLCLFDRTRTPAAVLESAACTHRRLVGGSGPLANPAFVEPAEYLRSLPLPDEPLERTPPRLRVRDARDHAGLRHAVAAELARVPGRGELVEDFLLAVDEMTSNAVRHGRPPVGLSLWIAADRVVCTVTDGGAGTHDPFAGFGPAHGDDLSRGGMGLWLARQLCDHVDITTGEGGNAVRLTTFLR